MISLWSPTYRERVRGSPFSLLVGRPAEKKGLEVRAGSPPPTQRLEKAGSCCGRGLGHVGGVLIGGRGLGRVGGVLWLWVES